MTNYVNEMSRIFSGIVLLKWQRNLELLSSKCHPSITYWDLYIGLHRSLFQPVWKEAPRIADSYWHFTLIHALHYRGSFVQQQWNVDGELSVFQIRVPVLIGVNLDVQLFLFHIWKDIQVRVLSGSSKTNFWNLRTRQNLEELVVFRRLFPLQKWSKSMTLGMSMLVFPEVELLCFVLWDIFGRLLIYLIEFVSMLYCERLKVILDSTPKKCSLVF